MRIAGRDEVDEIQEENDAVSLCSLFAASETFGIDTRKIREVLGERSGWSRTRDAAVCW